MSSQVAAHTNSSELPGARLALADAPRTRAPRVLILGSTYGDGHRMCAEALQAACRELRPDIECQWVDFFEQFVSRTVNAVVSFSYIQSVKRAPFLYGAFYRLTGKARWHGRVQRGLNSLGRVRLIEFLDRCRPDVIVSVYPTPAGVVSTLKLAGRLDTPCATVVTDYAVHSQWIHPGVDVYIVGNDDVGRGLRERGIDPARIRHSGIPVRATFREKTDDDAVRRRYGLCDELPVVLVMPGAYGMMAGTLHVLEVLAELPVQAVYVCGRDRHLRARLQPLADSCPRPAVVLGYVDEIAELMGIADLMVTKAGGLTVSEALVKGLPMVIYRAIPGQERANTQFLTEVGAATAVGGRRGLARTLGDLLSGGDRLGEMRDAALRAARPDAAHAAAREVLKLIPDGV